MPGDGGLTSFLFVTTGSEAVEAAVKLARRGRPFGWYEKHNFHF